MLIVQYELHLDPENKMLQASLKELNNRMMGMRKPADMNPRSPNNRVVEMEISNEQSLLSLEESGLTNARNLTVFQFEVFLKKNKEEIDSIKNANKSSKFSNMEG